MSDQAAIPMTAPAAVYRQRRARMAASLHRPLVIFSGHAPARNYPANAHVFRAGSSYLYFGGPPLEHAALLIEPGSTGQHGSTLLRPAPGPDDALWSGQCPHDDALAAAAGLPRGQVIDAQLLPGMLGGRTAGGIIPPCPDTQAWAARVRVQPATPDELLPIINLRLVKDEQELAAMRRAAKVAVQAHRAALAAVRPGRREADVSAAFMATLVAHDCQPSFTPIITIRGDVLHGQGHRNVLPEGALLLMDAGAEEPGGYASDITRTVPVNGRWTLFQRDVYDMVLRALRSAVAACVPGARYRDIHDHAARVICESLVHAGLLRGDPDELAARGAHALFYPHGTGHLIGLDVHDMEDFGDLAGYAPGRTRRTEFGSKFLRLDRDLEPGMCVTVEPGIYFVPAIWARADLVQPLADAVNRARVDALLNERFGGIRIEHTIYVRGAGPPEILTDELPVDADEIAACIGTG